MFARPRFPLAASLASALGLLAAGCSGNPDGTSGALTVYPVTGRVALDNGKPVTAGRVVFVSAEGTIAPSGAIGADGRFTLTTGEGREGAPAGEYKVRVEPAPAAGGVKNARPPFPLRYADEDASELKASVKPGPNSVDLTLSTKAGGPRNLASRGDRD